MVLSGGLEWGSKLTLLLSMLSSKLQHLSLLLLSLSALPPLVAGSHLSMSRRNCSKNALVVLQMYEEP